jgi:ABC-type cobalamin/Fe3+-siderophores transport system ATPase subunit
MRRGPYPTATRSSHDAVVTLEALTCGYDGRPVFRDVSLTLPAGQVIGLVGPNGSGKTTLLKAILGLMRPWRGRVRHRGGGHQPPPALHAQLRSGPLGQRAWQHTGGSVDDRRGRPRRWSDDHRGSMPGADDALPVAVVQQLAIPGLDG